MWVQFRWPQKSETGTYIRLDCDALGSTDNPRRWTSVVGNPAGSVHVPAQFRLEPGDERVRLKLSNAYHHAPLECMDFEVCFLPETKSPWGAVGLIFAEPRQIPALVQEMMTNYGHYRESAVRFSSAWRQTHTPHYVLHRLLGLAAESRPLAEQAAPAKTYNLFSTWPSAESKQARYANE